RVTVLRVQGVDRIEFDEVHAGLLQAVEKGRRRATRAVAVVDHVDGDALRTLGDEQIAEMDAVAFDVFQDEVFEIDVILRAVDGGKNRSKGVRTVAQDARAVPGNQGSFRERRLD